MRKTSGSGTQRYDYKRLMEELERAKKKKERLRPVVHYPQESPLFPQERKEEAVKTLKVAKTKLPRVVHWRSSNGKQVVVEGPFPEALFRSETRDSVDKARKLLVSDMFNRPQTTKPGQYAKVLAEDIHEVMSGENEFGEVSP